ncbi:VOC family protein [Paenibacillus sp. strain BS8-2]
MSKVIPILPCVSIDKQCEFYESIGFAIIAKYRTPNAYAVVSYEDIIFHFWGNKKNDPNANASMVFIEVEDSDILNAEFCKNIKSAWGKVPRTGFPRISKVRELKEDKRFTLSDPAGNTFYFGTVNNGKTVTKRTLDNEKHAQSFAVIYDLLHSHESPEKAAKALSVFNRSNDELNVSDREKLAVLTSEIEEALKEMEGDDK